MKKFAKLSLIATLAMAGSTTLSAQPLAQAIENVDVSGSIAYRYNDYEEHSAKNDARVQNIYKAALSLKSKVNDDVTASVRLIAGANEQASSIYLDPQLRGDGQVFVTLSEANFTYTKVPNTSFIVGKQGLATPFTIHRDAIGNEQTGTGAVAVTNVGPATFAAAYFNQTNLGVDSVGELNSEIPTTGPTGKLIGKEDVLFAQAMASFAGINADASYMDLDTAFSAYTIGLNASYEFSSIKLSPYGRYTALDADAVKTNNGLWKLGLRAKMGIFGAHIGYGETDKEGGIVAADYSAETGYDEHWRVTLTGQQDSSVIYASVNAQVLPTLNIALKYSSLDDGDLDTTGTKLKQDEEEIFTQITYKMSKNFLTYLRLGTYEVKNQFAEGVSRDSTTGRLHVQYSF